MSTDVTEYDPYRDPAELGWPPTLPIEVAMKAVPVKRICEAYGITREQWDELIANPRFISEVAGAVEALKKDGMSFKMKARLQAEELLKKSWKIINDVSGEVPPAVQADLIKSTMRWAGYDDKATAAGGQQNALQININLG